MPPLTPPQPPLSDDAITAEPMGPEHAEDFVRGTADPQVTRFAYAREFDLESAREHFADLAGTQRSRNEAIQFALRDDAGTFLGALLLNHFDWNRNTCDIGFWLTATARGRGVARRAIELGVAWAFLLGIERVGAQTAWTTSSTACSRATGRPEASPPRERPAPR